MADDLNREGLLVIRATADANGDLTARITHGTSGQEPDLQVSGATGANEILSVVRQWLDRIET